MLDKFTEAVVSFGKAIEDLGNTNEACQKHFADFSRLWYVSEYRRRMWFYWGFVGDQKAYSSLHFNAIRQIFWYCLGRNTGELLVGLK